MKKKRLVTMGAVIMMSLSACSGGISQEDHDTVVAEASQLSQELQDLKDQKSTIEKEKEDLKTQLESLSGDFETYKESMSAYEGLANAEATARQIEAEAVAASKAAEEEAIAASKAAEEEAIAAAAAAQKAAEEKAGYETGITYDQLARTPDDHKNKKVKFSGKAIQVVEGTGNVNHIRLAVNSDYDTIVYCEYDKSIVSSRILEDDKITIYGTSFGLYSYESTGGSTVTLPAVLIDKIDQ